MRVVFLVTDYPTDASRTAGIFHRTLAEALARASAQVEVVAPVPRVPWPMARLARKWADYESIPANYRSGDVLVHRPRYWQVPRGNYLALRHRSFARCLNRSVERAPDVIHAHFAYPCGLAAERAAARWRIPVVLTLHGSDVNVLPHVNRLTRRCFEAAVRDATFVSAVSGALADRTEGLTGRRPAVMPIGIDLRRFRGLPDQGAARQSLGLPGDRQILLFVGALLKAKGIDLLREALSQLNRGDVLGVFVGDGPMREEIANDPRCLSVGSVDSSKVPLYLRAADVLVLPSRSEGMPTVVVEAGAAGLPVVASAVGGIPELLAEDRGQLVPADSVPDLVACLNSVLSNRNQARERAKRLGVFVERAYDVDHSARAMMRIYESLR